MDKDAEALLALAKANPWWLFTAEEIAVLCNLSSFTLTAMRKSEDSPFCAAKTRPELVIAWVARHPEWQPSKQ